MLSREAPRGCPTVFDDVCGGIALGDRHDAVLAETPVDSDLRYCLSCQPRDLGECAIGIAVEETLEVVGQGAVRDDGNSVFLAILQQVGLDGAVHHVVADLIRDDRVFARGPPGALQLGD